jgi:hypothetical protein
MWKNTGRAPSLQVLPWHLPYNWGKSRKNLSQGKENLSPVKKNLSQSTVYILPKHPHITKPTQTHKLQNPQYTHKHILQNNIKPPQYKLKQTQWKMYPNEIVTI